MQRPAHLPLPIRTDISNMFAHHTMSIRVPGIIRDIMHRNPDYAPVIAEALEKLAVELEQDHLIKLFQPPAPDYDDWAAQIEPHISATWQNSEWFFAEVYLYRQIIQIVRWWESGRDPFATWKAEELASEALWLALDAALSTQSTTPDDRLAELLLHSLWGNRIDLSLQIAASHGTTWNRDDLLVDNREAVLRHLFQPATHLAGKVVHIVADNAGSELAMDLMLAHALVETGVAECVILHVKLHPTFVSDATASDVLSFIRLLEREGRNADQQKLGAQLTEMFEQKQLCLAPDPFWNSARFLWELPPRLQATFKDGILAIVKGDANYRRMVGDAIWNPETVFDSATGYFPIPLVALRTLKSDSIIGLPLGTAERLSTEDLHWRTNGRRGVIQFKRK
jgi:hypothetical protein